MNKQTPTNGSREGQLPSDPLPVCFTIPSVPPSMNALYAVNYRTRTVYLTNEARYWKTNAKLFVPNLSLNKDQQFKITMTVITKWYFKNGNPKKADVQNLGKVVLDALSERWGIDDCMFWELRLIKEDSEDKNEIKLLVESL